MQVIYKEDVFQVFDEYTKRYNLIYGNDHLIKEKYLVHYCKKFSVPYSKHSKNLRKIYDEWVKESEVYAHQ